MTLTIGQVIAEKIRQHSDSHGRAAQSRAGILGISDIGNCREFARLKTIGHPESDRRSMWKANVGTAIHAYIDDAMKAQYGDDVLTGVTVNCTYPNGAVLPGHPDLVFPSSNLVVDIKTVDGLHAVRKAGPTDRQWQQVMGYAKGLMDDETFDASKTVRCALVYADRSGREDELLSFEREYDPVVIAEASHWLEDVIYAAQHGEQASKDRPYDFCENYCEYFTDCRAADAAPEGGLIEDEDAVLAAKMYLEGHDLERKGKAMKNEAKSHLDGVTGSTGDITVKWTTVGPSEVPATVRSGYTRLDVKPVKRTK
jgi:hypothetical protein